MRLDSIVELAFEAIGDSEVRGLRSPVGASRESPLGWFVRSRSRSRSRITEFLSVTLPTGQHLMRSLRSLERRRSVSGGVTPISGGIGGEGLDVPRNLGYTDRQFPQRAGADFPMRSPRLDPRPPTIERPIEASLAGPWHVWPIRPNTTPPVRREPTAQIRCLAFRPWAPVRRSGDRAREHPPPADPPKGPRLGPINLASNFIG